jgi:hypothetical protein
MFFSAKLTPSFYHVSPASHRNLTSKKPNFVIPNPLVPTPDGLSAYPYNGPDAGNLTING